MNRPLNYRDVGETLGLWIEHPPIPPGRLLRGGRMDPFSTAADLGHPATILNLRRGPDPQQLAGVRYLHVPATDKLENYDTRQRRVRAWLGDALAVLASPQTTWPLYIHCTSGRDRTGVVIAATLLLLGVPPAVVIEEYMLSDGADRGAIRQAVAGILEVGGNLGVNRERLGSALAG